MTMIIRILLLSVCLMTVGCGDSRSVSTKLDSQPGSDSCCGVDTIKLDVGADADPTCPAARPTGGSACSATQPCSYEQSGGCYCGPATIWWDCTCVNGGWSCIPSGHCSPCVDFGPPDYASPDMNSCPPMPACNWCGGNPVTDANGCTTGYLCNNGVDPCSVQPCAKDADCKPTEVCAKDQLCWPGGP
jgi:hypothetical protein